MARPSNVAMSLKHLGDIADDIWYYAGDRSPDVSAVAKLDNKLLINLDIDELVHKTCFFGCCL